MIKLLDKIGDRLANVVEVFKRNNHQGIAEIDRYR